MKKLLISLVICMILLISAVSAFDSSCRTYADARAQGITGTDAELARMGFCAGSTQQYTQTSTVSTQTSSVADEISAIVSSATYQLEQKYPEFAKLQSLKFAVGENYQEDTFTLSENDEVVIIPPVSGG